MAVLAALGSFGRVFCVLHWPRWTILEHVGSDIQRSHSGGLEPDGGLPGGLGGGAGAGAGMVCATVPRIHGTPLAICCHLQGEKHGRVARLGSFGRVFQDSRLAMLDRLGTCWMRHPPKECCRNLPYFLPSSALRSSFLGGPAGGCRGGDLPAGFALSLARYQ
jgi:hypothetical protein